MKLTAKETKNWQYLVEFGDKDYYPSRPSDKEIEVYAKLLSKLAKKNDKVLLLGATAALRDLCLTLGCEITSVDYNLDVIKQMNQYMKHKNHPRDIIIKADWLIMPLKRNYYDFVLADGSFNNIDWEDNEKLLKRAKNVLKKGGYLLVREFLYRTDMNSRDIKDIINEYRKTKKFRDLKYNMRLRSPPAWSKEWYDKKTFKSKWKPYFEYQEKLHKQGLLTKQELDLIHAEVHNLVSTFPPIDRWEALLSKYFKIIERIACEYYTHTKAVPIYFAKVKK